MAYDLNQVVLFGRLTRDPEKRVTQDGRTIVQLGIANNPGKDPDKVSFFNVSVWDKQGEIVSEYLSKGSPIIIVGRLVQRRFETKEGQKVNTVEIIANNIHFVGTKAESNAMQSQNTDTRTFQKQQPAQTASQGDYSQSYKPTENDDFLNNLPEDDFDEVDPF